MLNSVSQKALLVSIGTGDTTGKNLTLVVDETVKEFHVKIINVARVFERVAALAFLLRFLALGSRPDIYRAGVVVLLLIAAHGEWYKY